MEAASEVLNPYASPAALEPALVVEMPAALWARGKDVVAHRRARWPRICVLSGVEGEPFIDLTVETHYPIWLFLVFISCFACSLALAAFLVPMPYTPMGVIGTLAVNAAGVIAALVYFARPAKLRFYLSKAMFAERRKRLRQAMLLNVAGGGAMAGSFLFFSSWTGPVFILGIVLIAIGGRLQRKWNGILLPIKMAREYSVFRGAGEGFLARLPEWPFGAV